VLLVVAFAGEPVAADDFDRIEIAPLSAAIILAPRRAGDQRRLAA